MSRFGLSRFKLSRFGLSRFVLTQSSLLGGAELGVVGECFGQGGAGRGHHARLAEHTHCPGSLARFSYYANYVKKNTFLDIQYSRVESQFNEFWTLNITITNPKMHTANTVLQAAMLENLGKG